MRSSWWVVAAGSGAAVCCGVGEGVLEGSTAGWNCVAEGRMEASSAVAEAVGGDTVNGAQPARRAIPNKNRILLIFDLMALSGWNGSRMDDPNRFNSRR